MGALVMLLSDILSQLPGSEKILPINAVTSLLGIPVVVWLIFRQKSIGNL
jgi:iron complex transport system permease protein